MENKLNTNPYTRFWELLGLVTQSRIKYNRDEIKQLIRKPSSTRFLTIEYSMPTIFAIFSEEEYLNKANKIVSDVLNKEDFKMLGIDGCDVFNLISHTHPSHKRPTLVLELNVNFVRKKLIQEYPTGCIINIEKVMNRYMKSYLNILVLLLEEEYESHYKG